MLVSVICSFCDIFLRLFEMKKRMFGQEKEIPDIQCPRTLKEGYKHAVVSRSKLLLFAGTRRRRTFPRRELLSMGINLTFFCCVPDVFV
jgi:hypothetical protein